MRGRRGALLGLLGLVAAVTFGESYRALVRAARAGGRPAPGLWPVSLEAFTAVLVLVYWQARAERRSAGAVRWLLVLTTGTSMGLQVLDAPSSVLGRASAAWTPLSLLLSVELLVWLFYGQPTRQEERSPATIEPEEEERERAPAPAPPPRPTLNAPPPRPSTPGGALPRRRGGLHAVRSGGGRSADVITQAWQQASASERAGMTARRMSELTGVSESYCGKRLALLRAAAAGEVSA